MPLLPSRQLDTVALFEEERNGRFHYAATGFFCRHRFVGEKSVDAMFLVTSAQAMRGNLDGRVLIGRRRRRAHPLVEPVTDKRGFARRTWFSDDECGLAVLPLDPEYLARTRLRFQAVSTTKGALTLSAMRRKRIGEGDDVLVLGFGPVLERLRPVPLVRRGIVARIHDCYQGLSNAFLVDATTFEGNRGGPVLMKPHRPAADRARSDPAGKLIGVVAESLPNPWGPVEATHDGRRLNVQVNTGLVRVVPVDALLRVLEQARPGGHS
ncbi:MAG: hypothetical protein OXH05_12205 [Acidobacteria bacterium]|nr:hypothetical protein [Acidobacteriota bacterium]